MKMKTFDNMRNPILPLDIHVPDSEAHVMPDGNLYVYGSFDRRSDVYCSGEYHVVSTRDMKHWTIGDISMKAGDIPWYDNPSYPHYQGIDWSKPTPFIQKMMANAEHKDDKKKFEDTGAKKIPLLFAPDCIFYKDRYYLFFCMNDDSEGVAVSNSPIGPFTDPVQLPCGGIDPAVFQDDDGKVYLYWGQLFSHAVCMNDDLTSFDESRIVDNLVTEETHYFHEGSSMRKIGSNYYYLYADMERGKPTALGYSIGPTPMGPFTYKGIVIDNDGCDPASWNNHGSIVCFYGQWYVFYHRCSRGMQQNRRLCVEKINILPNGTIPEVKMTSQGAGMPFKPGEMIMGYQACELHGQCYIGQDSKYAEKLMHIANDDTAYFRYIENTKEWRNIEITCKGQADIDVYMDGMKAGTVQVDAKAETTINSEISFHAGQAEVMLKFRNTGNLEVFCLKFN
jgi:arabinoxylan arabinofuranohydrolase